jgi:hypothetical protein
MKTLHKLVLAVVIAYSSGNVYAQTEKENVDIAAEISKIFSTKVSMDVDTVLFDTKQNNFYFSEKEKAMIMTMVAPQSFEKAEEHFEKEKKKKEYKILEKKKFVHNGKNVLFQRGLIKKDGQKAYMYMYAIEAGPESTIFISAMHMEGGESKFRPAIERAALSAKLEN